VSDYCEHGYRSAKRCPECRRPKRVSVYEHRPLLMVDPDGDYESGEWTYLGTLDPRTGRSSVDYSRARRWRSLTEFLWRR
jgi:hypothetical protein